MNKIFFLQGAPGVGKSAVVQGLRDALPRAFFIEVDIIRSFVGKPNWEAHDADYDMALEIIAKMVEQLSGKDIYTHIFIIDCISPIGVKKLANFWLTPLNFKQVVLWAQNEVIEKRLTGRDNHVFSNLAIAQKMNNWLGEYKSSPDKNLLFLDTTKLSLDQSIDLVKEGIQIM
jgi:hypothetical protein